MATLLEIKNLHTSFVTTDGEFPAVDGLNLSIEAGKTLGLVGESGCGKSVTALSIMRLIPSPPGRVADGEILYRGEDLLKLPDESMRQVRGNEISMVFQEPMTSLNPVFTVGDQIMEAVRLHQKVSRREAKDKAVEMLRLVKIADPDTRVNDYPHQMSGGMRQRVMIAMALSCNPSLLIADEPTTALDVTIQAQILDLMGELQDQLGMALLLITHDLGVVAEQADEVAIIVRRPDGRTGQARGDLQQTPPPLHHRAAELAAQRHHQAPAGRHPRCSTESAGPSQRVPVPGPLLQGHRDLRRP